MHVIYHTSKSHLNQFIMKIYINTWQQIKYSAYRYYLVDDRFLNGYVYVAVLSVLGLYMSISSHMDPLYAIAFGFAIISALFQPFLFKHWGTFKGETMILNLNDNLLYIQKSSLTYIIDLTRHSFKKIAGYYVLVAGDQVFFFTQSQFNDLRR